MRKIIPAGIAAAAIAGAAIAGCTTSTATKTPSTPAASSPAAPSTPAAPLTGPVGTTFQITDNEAGTNGSGTGVYTVQATQVLDPAAPDNAFDAAPTGQHLVGVSFTIVGKSGTTVSDDANNDAVVQGSNGQDYQANDGGIAAGTDFNSGDFNAAPGTSVIGWVNFQLPDGVTVAHVQWTPDSGQGGSTVTWTP